ncbi:hypothetical protein [Streptomyces minutiscleroticus]|nr:hypothetical protein [Streptomyces minutiscleroticus]
MTVPGDDGWYSRHVAVLVTAPYYENLHTLAPQRTRLPDGRSPFSSA